MQQQQTAEVLRYIQQVSNLAVPKVYIHGGIASGKSTLLAGIHSALRYHQAGLEIKQNRHRAGTDRIRSDIRQKHLRAAATISPESFVMYVEEGEELTQIELIA